MTDAGEEFKEIDRRCTQINVNIFLKVEGFYSTFYFFRINRRLFAFICGLHALHFMQSPFFDG